MEDHQVELSKISTIDLSGQELGSIPEEMRYLTGLTDLNLGSNRISDLTPISGLTNLTHLSIDDNPITDLNPIFCLKKLTSLRVIGCQIADLTQIDRLPQAVRNDVRDQLTFAL